jgi:hypothetical protein
MLEALQNAEGKNVYPSSATAFIEDIPNASEAIFSDEQYNSLKSGVSNPNPETTSQESQVQNAGSDPASQTQGEERNDQIAPAPTSEQQPEVIDLSPILKEKTGGKYEKLEDLIAELDKAPKISEEGRKVFELINGGQEQDLMEYFQKKQVLAATETMSASDKVKMHMQIENPDWTLEDVEDEFSRQYGLGFDPMGVDENTLAKEKRRVERMVNSAARKADELFAGLRAELKFPELQLKDDKAVAYAAYEKQSAERKTKDEALVADINKVLPSFKNIDLSFTSKDVSFNHQFEVREEEKIQLLAELQAITQDPLSRYYKDGQWQTNNLIQELYAGRNLKTIVQSAVNKALAEAKLQTVKGIANAEEGRPGQVPADVGAEAAREAKRKFLLA